MALRFEGHRPAIVAVDGQPRDPHEPADGYMLLGPARRADVMLDMQGEPGRSYRVVDDSTIVCRIRWSGCPTRRLHRFAGIRRTRRCACRPTRLKERFFGLWLWNLQSYAGAFPGL
jgi:hypothetical protein